MLEEKRHWVADYREDGSSKPVDIRVIGIGGAGGNAINRMMENEITGVELVAINTDVQALGLTKATKRLQIGARLTNGRGAGGNPQIGRQAAEEDRQQIASLLENAEMVFLAAGMGGGTGTGATPVVAQIAREKGILTVAVVTKPFAFEGKRKMEIALQGINELRNVVDALIVIPNQRLFELSDRRTTMAEAFKLADEVLTQAVQGITDLVVRPGWINVDFADVRAVLENAGVKSVSGDIVIDVSAFSDNRWGAGWSWDYLHYGYAAEVWAIALDRNSVTLQVSPALREGEPAQTSIFPATDWLTIDNRIVTVKSGEPQWSIWRDPWERVIHLWGRISLSASSETVRVSVPSVPHYVGEIFRATLKEMGIAVEGSVRVGQTPSNALVIAESQSPPLKEIVRWLNKVSDNLYAEMLLRAVALKERGQGSVSIAMQVLRQQLSEWGIDPDDVQLFDGSGLSRLNMVTPQAIVKLLQVARTRPWFDTFKESLPIAGKDGTLRTRFQNTPAEGRVFAKTGYIGSVVALSGYIQRADGSDLVFSILVNHYNAPTRQVQARVDRFVTSLVGSSEALAVKNFTSSVSNN